MSIELGHEIGPLQPMFTTHSPLGEALTVTVPVAVCDVPPVSVLGLTDKLIVGGTTVTLAVCPGSPSAYTSAKTVTTTCCEVPREYPLLLYPRNLRVRRRNHRT